MKMKKDVKPFKKHDMMIGGVTVGDIRRILKERDDDELVYLEGFDFYACEDSHGNIEFYRTKCPKHMKELW